MHSRWQKGEITTFIVLGVLALIGVATFLNTTLNQQPKTVGTNAQTCNFDSGQAVQLGSTETNQNNMENRFPISSNRHEYDFFSYFNPATIPEAQSSGMPVLTQSLYLSMHDAPPGATDSKVAGMMGKMFGYKPNQLADAYFMKYKDAALQGADTLVKGSAPALKVPINAGDPVMMPATDYDIGGGKEAMVVFAAADRITLHMSRSEYIAGSGGNNCNGGPCSGGYWIYIRGICVDQQIQNAYNSVKAAQESAGANKNPIQLPMVDPGQILGKASGNAVEVMVRDNGPLISIHKPFYWQGVPEKSFTAPTPTTGIGFPTATSAPAAPTPVTTIWPTVTPTIPVGAQCGYGGLRCCNPSDPVPVGTSCYAGLTCTNNVCGVAPTATPIPTTLSPTATVTPTPNKPTIVPPLCKTLDGGTLHENKYDLVMLPGGYTDYSKFETDAEKVITALRDTNLGTLLNKFIFKVHTDTTRPYAIVPDTDNYNFPKWDRDIATSAMRDCNGDSYMIILDVPTKNEIPPAQWDQMMKSWGNTGGIALLGAGGLVLRGFEATYAPHELGHSIAGADDEYSYGITSGAGEIPRFNCSTDPSSVGACPKWADTTKYPGTGCFQTCGYTNWYRPTDNSIMNTGVNDYNAPTLEMFRIALQHFQ